MLFLFFLCATMARTARRTGKTLRMKTRVMTTATRSTSSVLECVLGSDFKGFFFPVGQVFFSYLLCICVRHTVSRSIWSMLSCRAVPFARRRRRRVSNNCACVAAADVGEVSLSKGRQGRLHETRPRTHTDVRKKIPRGGKINLCSSLVTNTAQKALLCPPIRPPPGHASAAGAPLRSASRPKRLELVQKCLQVERLRAQWRVQWCGGNQSPPQARPHRPPFPQHHRRPLDRHRRQRQPPQLPQPPHRQPSCRQRIHRRRRRPLLHSSRRRFRRRRRARPRCPPRRRRRPPDRRRQRPPPPGAPPSRTKSPPTDAAPPAAATRPVPPPTFPPAAPCAPMSPAAPPPPAA